MADRTTTYYDRTAANYDELHSGSKNTEHIRALERSWPIPRGLSLESVVDIGCGTGRSLEWFHQRTSSLRLMGVDPSGELLKLARDKLPEAAFLRGIGERLPLEDGSADLVVATAIMHHVDCPRDVIREMFRVAKKAVLVSDHNNFAFGGTLVQRLRLFLYASGLLGMATFIKQGFRTQGYSEEDGWWYPYSIFSDHALIASLSAQQYIIPTRPVNLRAAGNLLLAQSHLAILAIKTTKDPALAS